VASQDLARLEVSPDIAVWRTPSYRVMYLLMDSFREAPLNNLRDLEGRPLATNPLRDRRVRLALSRAISRDTLIERVMEGLGVPAGQLVPPALFGHDPTITAPTQDVALARQLLAEAGWANGFQMTLHSPSGLWPNDSRVTQSIAQMLTRLGLVVDVETVPPQMYSSRATKFEFSVAFYGWGTDTGEAGAALRGLVQTRDDAAATGPSNRGRYSNPALDELIVRARSTFDNAARERLYQEAMRMAMDDVAVVPLYFPIGTWATRGGISYVPRLDEFTLAMSAKPR
jgi:peptide/nickel transport system substrate-binding protein